MTNTTGTNGTMLASLEIVLGEISNAEARVYARLPTADAADQYRLHGSVTGPYCQYNRTLPATIPLVDCGPGSGLLAQAIVPDPCFWSPDLPMVYRANVEIQQAGRTIAHRKQLFGVKPLGVRGSQLIYDGKNLVLRAVRWEHVPRTPLHQWRESLTAIDIDDPDDAWLEEVSHVGAWVIARLRNPWGDLSTVIRRLARWPAVALIVVESLGGTKLPQIPGNCLLAEVVHSGAGQTDVICPVLVADAAPASTLNHQSRPILVQRGGRFENLAEARRACDSLQAELAPQRQFAGYIV